MLGAYGAFHIFSSDDAQLKLKELLAYFREGMKVPLKFTLEATQPPNKKTKLSIETILNSFREEADGNYQMAPNKYMQILFQEGYLEDFDEDDFEELKKLAGLLNLITA